VKNFLIIPDKFKGSIDAIQVSKAVKNGLHKVYGDHFKSTIIPASDGGDGFLDTIYNFKPIRKVYVRSVDAFQIPMDSYYLLDTETNTAYIELANTVGIRHLQVNDLNILKATTHGVGVQIAHALEAGITTMYIGLGGSASNDMSLGLLEALGFIFYDAHQESILYSFDNLFAINSYALPETLKNKIKNCSFYAVNDVLNPLCGPIGTAITYGPQKGGTKEIVNRLDTAFKEFTTRFNFPYSHDITLEGGGAAGGTAYGLKAFLNAQFINGFDFLASIARLEDLLVTQKYDFVISGEGSLDNTSFYGKLLGRLIDLTQEHQLPLLLVCGQSHFDVSALTNIYIIELLDEETPIAQCLAQPFPLIENKVFHFFKSLL
tara:strand:+ start:73 stop:1200 length:1128 start_codon:yes stop_codon:yes gene_type:complete